ncbi:hypothetical protein FE810_13170 [Thalassotalea litorea]|uniref:Alginate export domain-containing protein n=1 Tax=Thalassotalea litorea TaxID=2020715 RepID=A0A5R9IEH0_9GAMM|nr:alginate export family protein [Thalassotalea litorea]TLU62001.1 hypothetical protein FE810_13170 [Thalassotalea litorea]
MRTQTVKNKHHKLSLIAGALLTGALTPTFAVAADDIASAVSDSTANVMLRYRLETVDQDGKTEDAMASTLKTRLTWTSAPLHGVSALVEVDNVSYIGADQFNSTNNGKTDYPVVADPKGTDINQAAIKFTGEALTLVGGRQRINLDNQRFVGGVGWRQNEQTYDGARVTYNATEKLTLDYSLVFNVNRIFGPDDGAQPADWHGTFHFANGNYKINDNHKVTAFAYLIDNDDAAATSTDTYGLDYVGSFGPVTASVSYANQVDAGDNPNEFSANYFKAELAGNVGPVKVLGGLEVLGSDNGVGFSTPLATLHKFQGFADKFLGTPGNGIEDLYVSAITSLGGVKLIATYHDFSSDKNSISYGSEIDLVAAYKVNNNADLLVKFASYDADELATDTSKFWAMATVKF